MTVRNDVTVQLMLGDCLERMKELPDNSVDSIVTDPPYELGFMGKSWDKTGIANNVEMWREAMRVLKPGGHLLSFSGSRTYHRMTCAIEDAGFEIRDQIMWVYGSGFPKSLNVSIAIDKSAGVVPEKVPRVRSDGKATGREGASFNASDVSMSFGEPVTDAARQWDGWGTALKPAHEPICVARKPLQKKTVAANVLEHGTGALNIDGCRVGDGTDRTQGGASGLSAIWNEDADNVRLERPEGGRWPANIIHDGSKEVIASFPDVKDSPARFFYCAKANKNDRGEGNNHPTVKPTELMRYLVRLVTPPNGVVLDPFLGSGSTGKACVLEGFNFIGIDMAEEYVEIARQRIEAAQASVAK